MGWPGYISTKSNEINDFRKEILNNNLTNEGYFFKAINGKTTLVHPQTNQIIESNEYINEIFGGYHCSHKQLKDHSKILAFIEFNNSNKSKDLTELLKNGDFNVKALLVGSSNQSYNTYCKSPTPKGEADVFMIECNEKNIISEEQFINNIIVNYQDENYNFSEEIIITKEVENSRFNTNLKTIVLTLLKDIII